MESQTSLSALEEPFAKEEIRGAIFPRGLNKAPGPDGFNLRIYQHFWPILQQDFINIFQAFYDGNLHLTQFNRAYIVLRPKIAGARRISDFRSINDILKIIFKVLAGRLKQKIGELIQPSQSASLHDRSILDSVASAQKIISAYTNTIGQPTSSN